MNVLAAPERAPQDGIADPRSDFLLIRDLVRPGSRVLDVGCNDGSLLELLQATREVDGRGVELSQAGVNECVARGLSVVQGDADTDLVNYPADAFDYVILSQTIQATRNPHIVLGHLLRIGRSAIVSFPNFGNWRVRLSLLARGRMPVTHKLPCSWYDTPNIHFCTVRDFVELCAKMDARIDQAATFTSAGRRLPDGLPLPLVNLLAGQALFVLSRRTDD